LAAGRVLVLLAKMAVGTITCLYTCTSKPATESRRVKRNWFIPQSKVK
jgi:hypothetical protein